MDSQLCYSWNSWETLINLLVKLKLLVGEKQVGAVQLSDTI